MGRKILVAQIGKLRLESSGEAKVNYYAYFSDSGKDDGDKYIKETKDIEAIYPFLAYLKAMGGEAFTDLILIGTRESTWKAFLKNGSPDILGGGVDKVCEKLADDLKEKYNVNTKIVIVENGATVTEIDRNFDKIKEKLECIILSDSKEALDQHNDNCDKEISIYLDISNSFRSVPMLVFAATNYLSVLHNELKFSLDVYCSVGESTQNSVIPIVNITAVSVINQWSMAINEFYDSGSVVKLMQLIRNGEDEWFLDYVTENGRREKCPKKSEIIKALEEFSFAVNSNNLNAFISAVKTIISIRLDKDKMPVYISDFMDFLVRNFKERFAVVNDPRCYGSLTLAIARWYADQSRFGDAVVALQEGIVTYVIENYVDDVKELLKKRTGIADAEADALEVNGLITNDECRSLIHSLIFTYDEEYEDFEEYLKEHPVAKEVADAWKNYLGIYDYICKNLRNPAMKLQYLSVGIDAVSADESDDGRYDMKKAEECINYCIDVMIGNDETVKKDYIQCKLKYLNNIKVSDFFISYKRRYKTNFENDIDNDGYKRAKGIAEVLESEDGRKGKYNVWMDDELKKETGGDFTPIIREAIRNSRYFIVLLGNNVFNQSLYKDVEEQEKPVLQPFYEEIITAYKHFKEDSENRIIVVTFDNYQKLSEGDRKKVKLLEDKEDVKERHKEAAEYYDMLTGLATTKMQVHPVRDDDYRALVDELLETNSLKQERQRVSGAKKKVVSITKEWILKKLIKFR